MPDAMAEEIRCAETPAEEFVERAPGDSVKVLERVLAARCGDDPGHGSDAGHSASALPHRLSNSHISSNPISSCISPIEKLPAPRPIDEPFLLRCP